MAAVTYKCPGCGGFVEDDPDKEVLTCARCGTTITKELSEYDRSLKYLKEKDIRQAEADREEKEYQRKKSKAGTIGAWCFLLLIFGLMILKMKGII